MHPIKKRLAKMCDNCPLCNYARNNPKTKVGMIMEWHGKYCPMWSGQKELAKSQPKKGHE